MRNRITHCLCICHLVTSLLPHFTLHHSTSNTISGIIPNHTTVHVAPSFLNISRILYHTSTSPRSTLFHFAIPYFKSPHVSATLYLAPHLALHPISKYVQHNATFHTLHATFQITPYIGHSCASHHTTFYTTLHCIPPHLTVITPDSTSHYHVSHNIPHHTVHHHILHPTTCYISHNATSTTTHRAVSQPTLCIIPHHTTFHIACHGTCTNPYYTTTLHNPGLQPCK